MYFFEEVKSKRYLQIACAVIWCLFAAGPIFGFAALKPILVDQRVYENVCDFQTKPEKNILVALLNTLPLPIKRNEFSAKCADQDLKLNMMFTVGAALTNVSALVIGRTLDTYGPRICGLIGAFFIAIGSLSFIYADSILSTGLFDPYLVGYSSMALGGPFTYISSFQLSNAFPEKSGLVLALLTGAFDTSSAVFLIYNKSYLRYPDYFTIETFFKVYLAVPLFILVVQLTIMPNESYLTPPLELISNPTDDQRALTIAAAQEEHIHSTTLAEEFNEHSALLNQQGQRRRSSLGDAFKSTYIEEEVEEAAKSKLELSFSIFGILHGYPAFYQFKTWWFILIGIFATIQMLRLNYSVATINSQYLYLFGSADMANSLNSVFDIALPLGGVVSIPFVGMFLDHFSTSVVLISLLMVSLLIGVLGVVKNSYISGLINVFIFVAYRPFFYTSISDYCAKVFGFETFGTVYGSIMTIAGLFNFLQTLLDRLTHTKFEMNPIPLNLLLLGITVIIGLATVTYVTIQTRIYAYKKLQTDTDIETSD